MERRAFYQEAVRRIQEEGKADLTTWLSGEKKGQKEFGRKGREEETFWETLYGPLPVVVLGGGHVSRALEKILKTLELHLTILDDREEFASREQFKLADEVLSMDFERDFPRKKFPEETFYVIVTRGHQYDYLCLKEILNRPYGYVGMIGSRKKVAETVSRLLREGVSEKQILDLHAPIGLPIGGKTPAEIAVSIAAEIISVKERTEREQLENDLARALFEEKGPLVMATVLKKEGSSPRGRGSRMLVGRDGILAGSIGGGSVEYAALCHAQKALGTTLFEKAEYSLSGEEAAGLGMICGGRIEVLFEGLEPIEE